MIVWAVLYNQYKRKFKYKHETISISNKYFHMKIRWKNQYKRNLNGIKLKFHSF